AQDMWTNTRPVGLARGSLLALLTTLGCSGEIRGGGRTVGVGARTQSGTIVPDQSATPGPGSPTAMPPESVPAPAPAAIAMSPYPESVLCPRRASIQAATGGLSAGFASQCAGCHGTAGLGQGPFPSLRNVPTVDAFIATVRMGRNQMPAFTADAIPDAMNAS